MAGLLLPAAAEADVYRYTFRIRDTSANSARRVPQFFYVDTAVELPVTDVAEGDFAYAADTDQLNIRTASAWSVVGGLLSAYATLMDEASPLTQRLVVNFTGAGVSCADDIPNLRTNCTISGGAGAGLDLTVVEVDLGATPRYSGTFDVTGLSGLTPNDPVLVTQAAGPYTGKGDRQDEAEMDQVTATGYVVDANTIRVYWTCQPKNGPVVGNIKFQYAVG